MIDQLNTKLCELQKDLCAKETLINSLHTEQDAATKKQEELEATLAQVNRASLSGKPSGNLKLPLTFVYLLCICAFPLAP